MLDIDRYLMVFGWWIQDTSSFWNLGWWLQSSGLFLGWPDLCKSKIPLSINGTSHARQIAAREHAIKYVLPPASAWVKIKSCHVAPYKALGCGFLVSFGMATGVGFEKLFRTTHAVLLAKMTIMIIIVRFAKLFCLAPEWDPNCPATV